MNIKQSINIKQPGSICPCGTGHVYSQCCGQYIDSLSTQSPIKAPTAEKLMRSRYTAYVNADVAYLVHTTYPASRQFQPPDAIRQWAETTQWKGLEIISAKQGRESDNKGIVEFKAHYLDEGVAKFHHEKSTFLKYGGEWFFYYEPPSNKQGRNAPCSCGSGKKFKKCCG